LAQLPLFQFTDLQMMPPRTQPLVVRLEPERIIRPE